MKRKFQPTGSSQKYEGVKILLWLMKKMLLDLLNGNDVCMSVALRRISQIII
jgi:hypothetical protein